MKLGVHRLWNYVELFWNSLDNPPSSIVFYLEIKEEVKVGVHDIRSRLTPRHVISCNTKIFQRNILIKLQKNYFNNIKIEILVKSHIINYNYLLNTNK